MKGNRIYSATTNEAIRSKHRGNNAKAPFCCFPGQTPHKTLLFSTKRKHHVHLINWQVFKSNALLGSKPVGASVGNQGREPGPVQSQPAAEPLQQIICHVTPTLRH